MIIKPDGTNVKKPVELTRDHIQAIVDAQTMFEDMGMEIEIWCKPCRRVGDDFECKGENKTDDDLGVFTIECGCRLRSFTGRINRPVFPHVVTDVDAPVIEAIEKPELLLLRPQMVIIDTFEQALDRLDLQYILRCVRCRLNDLPSDGVHGVGDSTAMETVFQCGCTRRVYRAADAPVLTQRVVNLLRSPPCVPRCCTIASFPRIFASCRSWLLL